VANARNPVQRPRLIMLALGVVVLPGVLDLQRLLDSIPCMLVSLWSRPLAHRHAQDHKLEAVLQVLLGPTLEEICSIFDSQKSNSGTIIGMHNQVFHIRAGSIKFQCQ